LVKIRRVEAILRNRVRVLLPDNVQPTDFLSNCGRVLVPNDFQPTDFEQPRSGAGTRQFSTNRFFEQPTDFLSNRGRVLVPDNFQPTDFLNNHGRALVPDDFQPTDFEQPRSGAGTRQFSTNRLFEQFTPYTDR
jgi:hypothetical protein